MKRDLLASIRNQMPKFSKGQRLIAAFVLEHYEKAAYMTASKLGSLVGVSESTVVRFANELGFEGYPEFRQKSLWRRDRKTCFGAQNIHHRRALVIDASGIPQLQSAHGL